MDSKVIIEMVRGAVAERLRVFWKGAREQAGGFELPIQALAVKRLARHCGPKIQMHIHRR
jgi:hypothetical protein